MDASGPNKLTEIAGRHWHIVKDNDEGCFCGQPWPCDAALLVQRIERLEAVVQLILPLAKGYAAEHQDVLSNQRYVLEAQHVLAEQQKEDGV